jgi:hypothetical protein
MAFVHSLPLNETKGEHSSMKKWKPKAEEDYAESSRRGQIKGAEQRMSHFRIAKTPPPPLNFKFKRVEEGEP